MTAKGRTGRLFSKVIPSRASTQTWMILTFVLFIGIAVVAVGLYVTFVVRTEIQLTIQRSMYQDADRVAAYLESAPSDSLLIERAADAARISGLRITVLRDGDVLADYGAPGAPRFEELAGHPEFRDLAPGAAAYDHREVDGMTTYYAALDRPQSGLVVRVGQLKPPLFSLLARQQLTLIAAMILALALAILGSWIAAARVTEPLQSIRNSARAIIEGRAEERITVDSRASEFQDLAASLNRMSDSFKTKIGDLQRLAALQNEFIGNVSHEVRNPIFAVGGYLEALASSSLNAKQRRFYAEKALANLERLNNLFNDLIEIARLEYREDLIKPDIFDLQDLLDEVDDMLVQKATEKGLELQTENPNVLVSADRNRIRQVLINLIDNAIAYSDEGTVRCRTRRHLGKVRIEVVDTGRGIPDEHLERIFERFYRVDPDRSRKSGGTGLGLSIVKQILHAHGESIHVESTPGRSTRFSFELPFVEEDSEQG